MTTHPSTEKNVGGGEVLLALVYTLRVALWGGIAASIVPAYGILSVSSRLDTFLTESRRYNLSQETSLSAAGNQQEGPPRNRALDLLAQVGERERQREQAFIQRFQSSLEDSLGIDCNSWGNFRYEMPTLQRRAGGLYELRMRCGEKELVISFPREKVTVRSSPYQP